MSEKLKIGLALGSGAARGWAHIGIIRQLEKLGIIPDIVTGTSIGALVGAAYVANNIDKLNDWVLQLDKLKTAQYFAINRSLQGFVNKNRLRSFLDEYVVDQNLDIESVQIRFATVATDLYNGREVWNMRGNMMDAVWSSMSLPGLFPAIKHNNRWLIDGGLVNPVPVSLCRAMGADVVIAVNLNSGIVGKHFRMDVDDSEPETTLDTPTSWTGKVGNMVADYTNNLFPKRREQKEEAPALLDAIAASINITQDRITRSRMAGDPPEIILNPRLSHIGILEFYRADEAIKEGIACVNRQQTELSYYLSIDK
ncbi:patatin-like phospholipase family protein [Methylophaga sulfidovorans]|uniref:NTE family protein n=1 Tax=Methylophaga sulfidovorans TaxID=45496 RepID=A0A1I3ZPQ9_9GAMM|nr:patatin-like phospholipase family protein [Methylophaga sulfidovorans]SFK45539.1 NTE family protein [Methylophaga sulfidovorans]